MPPSASPYLQAVESCTPVFIDILPENPRFPSHALSSSTTASSSSAVTGTARRIRDINPTVTFMSPAPITGKSSYIVLLDGAPIHSEDTQLEYVGPYCPSTLSPSVSSLPSPSSSSVVPPAITPTYAHASHPQDNPVLYNAALVPRYWDVLCKATDPTLYTIIQNVFHTSNKACLSPSSTSIQRQRPVKVFSAKYHFRYSFAMGTEAYPSQPSSYSASYTLQVYPPSTIPAGDTQVPSASSFSPMLTLHPHRIAHAALGPGGMPCVRQEAAQLQPGVEFNHVTQRYAYTHGQGHLYGQSQSQAQAHSQVGSARYGPYPTVLPASPRAAAFSLVPSTHHSSLPTACIRSEPMATPLEEDFFRFDDLESSPSTGSNPGQGLDVASSNGGSTNTRPGSVTSASGAAGETGSMAGNLPYM